MIFPFGGENTPGIDELMQAARTAPAELEELEVLTPLEWDQEWRRCVSRSGVKRNRHSPDKDGRCVFCDRLLIPHRSPWRPAA